MKRKSKATIDVIRRVTEQLLEGEAVDLGEIREKLHQLEGVSDAASYEAILDLASALWQSGELTLASEIYNRCIGLRQFPMIRSRALLGRGIVAAKQSAFKDAFEWMEAAAQVAEKQHNYAPLQVVRRNQLSLLKEQGEWDELAQKGRAWAKANNVLLIELMFDAASAMHDLERYEDAIAILEQGAVILSSDVALQVKLKWLAALTRNLRAAGDDYLTQVYCVEAIQSQRLQETSDILQNLESRQELCSIYDLLIGMYLELEENDPALQPTTLFVSEALKELKFSSPLVQGALKDGLKWNEDAIILELAAKESALEYYYRRQLGAQLGGRPTLEVAGPTTPATPRPAYEPEELARQLESLRTNDPPAVIRFDTQIDDRVLNDLEAWWPWECVGLAYRLDLQESILHICLIQPGGNLLKFRFDTNYAAIRALLNICKQGIDRELEFMADRLTEILLPKPLREKLCATKGQTLILSADPSLQDVPWEALGTNGDYLGTSFDLILTPSLLRSTQQLRTRSNISLRPSEFTIIANPTQDLPFTLAEAKTIEQLLSKYGFETRLMPACQYDEFLTAMSKATWLHYAGHANYLYTDPGASYLHLQDHLLTVREIAAADIARDTVWILNACEAGRAGGSERVGYSLGLSRILLLKGAAGVIAANWPTDDEASAQTLVQFYQQFVEGHLSLAGSMRAVRQSLVHSGYSMYEWAQYSVFGHPFVMMNRQNY